MTHIGYKKCRDNKIVILEILGDNNENRKNIFDKNCANYRCSKARVLKIYNMHDRCIEYDNAFGIYDPSFEYMIGKTIEPKTRFDSNLEEVCSSGIHYFLTEEPAYFWNYEPGNGPYKSWYNNGQIYVECTYIDGHVNGLLKKYYDDGRIKEKYIYEDGIIVR